jgi:hypothetical protein
MGFRVVSTNHTSFTVSSFVRDWDGVTLEFIETARQ